MRAQFLKAQGALLELSECLRARGDHATAERLVGIAEGLRAIKRPEPVLETEESAALLNVREVMAEEVARLLAEKGIPAWLAPKECFGPADPEPQASAQSRQLASAWDRRDKGPPRK